MSVRKGFLISLASANTSMLISFIASLFLARLLTPHEIGVFSVAYVFAGLLRTLREMGLGSYIVQEKELTPLRIRTAFGISIAFALITAAVLVALAGPAGQFYREPGITEALYVIAATFLFVPFGATTMSLLRREMRFGDLAVIEMVTALVQNTTAVVLAFLGVGFMSLAWASLAGMLASVLMVAFYRPASMPWRPSLLEWRRVLGFSSYVSGAAMVNYINYGASDLVLGRMLNVSSVALFNRANGLSEMVGPVILRAVNAVSLPYFSEKSRRGEDLLPVFLRSSGLLLSAALPIYLVMLLLAAPLIQVLFGPQWLASIVVLQWLCLSAMLRMPMALANQLLTGIGQVRALLWLDVRALAVKLVCVVAGALHSLEAVAVAWCLATLLASLMRFAALHRHVGLRAGHLGALLRPAAMPCLLAGVGPALLAMSALPAGLVLGAGLFSAALGWLLGVLMFSGPMGEELRAVAAKLGRKGRVSLRKDREG